MYQGVWVKKSGNTIHYYDFGKFRLDVTNRELLKNGKHVPLTQKSFELLEFLIENRGRGLRKNEILNGIWTESFVEEANLAQHIYMVRKALKDNGDTETYIETIPKYGYRFIGDVTEEMVEMASGSPALTPESVHSTGNGKAIPADSSADVERSETVQHKEGEALPETAQRVSVFQSPVARWVLFGVLLLGVVSALGYFAFIRPPGISTTAEIKSIAILPFNQIGDAPDQKLGLGLADTLISKLGNQNKISVSPTSTIIKFFEKGTDNPIEIGEQLGVDAVLTGTIQRENETVRVNVQLISVKEKTPKWSDKFDAEFSDIFSLQDKVAEQVANRLAIKLGEPAETTETNKFTENIEAYQAYTLGLFYWDKRSQENLPKAIDYFETAIEKDPKFATAHALAADAYSLIAFFKFDTMPETEAINKARELANRAL